MLSVRNPVRVVGVGHVSLDHVFNLPALSSSAVKTPAPRDRDLVGGVTANSCTAAARLGAAVRIYAPICPALLERHATPRTRCTPPVSPQSAYDRFARISLNLETAVDRLAPLAS